MERWNFLPGKDGLQIPGDGAVLQNEAGDADAAVFPDVGVDRAVLPQGQIGLQVGQAGGDIFEIIILGQKQRNCVPVSSQKD